MAKSYVDSAAMVGYEIKNGISDFDRRNPNAKWIVGGVFLIGTTWALYQVSRTPERIVSDVNKQAQKLVKEANAAVREVANLPAEAANQAQNTLTKTAKALQEQAAAIGREAKKYVSFAF